MEQKNSIQQVASRFLLTLITAAASKHAQIHGLTLLFYTNSPRRASLTCSHICALPIRTDRKWLGRGGRLEGPPRGLLGVPSTRAPADRLPPGGGASFLHPVAMNIENAVSIHMYTAGNKCLRR